MATPGGNKRLSCTVDIQSLHTRLQLSGLVPDPHSLRVQVSRGETLNTQPQTAPDVMLSQRVNR